MKLKDLYLKDIEREIQGVVKVDDDNFVSQELEEYVLTEELLKYFGTFFDAYKKGIDGRTDKMGVWISGFFGSGKSHFLKILSYLLDNKTVNGKKAVDYFDDKIKDNMLLADIKRAGSTSSDVILFNIDSKASLDNNENKDKILSVFEKVFNERLGLSTIAHVAELERYLIKQGKYEEFKSNFKTESNVEWIENRNDFYFRRDEIINAYSKTMNQSVTSAENWFDKAEENYDITIEKFAERVREHILSKGNDHHVVFLVDEVGQYIGDDTSLMLNLQTLVEELGTVCGGKAWVVVTSQQNIDEVIKVKGNDFSKIIGRFDTRLPLSSANVDEVIKKRILSKNDAASESLDLLYGKKESTIKNLLTFTKSAEQKNYRDKNDFIEVYPFIPYQFKLLQSVFGDIRKHGFAGKHLSEGERSLLGAFQETAKRTANNELGSLIPFNAFYDTIEQFLEHQIRIVIDHATKNDNLKEEDIKVLKLLFMLKNVKEVPATIDNIATLFVSNIDDDKLEIKNQIKDSLRRLEKETLIQRNNEEYLFLTDKEQEINREIKNIAIDANAVNDFLKKIIFGTILTDRKFMFNNKYPFSISLYLDGSKLGAEAEMGLRVVTSSIDRGDMAIIAESMREPQYAYIKLNMASNVMEEITNILQVTDYIKQKNSINLSSQIEDIIKAKSREVSKEESRIKEVISELLKESDIYIGGDKQRVNSKTPIERTREALNILVGRVYSKISYVEKNFSTQDIRTLFHEPMTNLLGNEVERPNKKAYDEIKEYCKEYDDRRIPISIRSLLQNFGKQPYGFLDEDILYLLTRLLKDEFISLVYNSEVQSLASDETLTRILNRANYEKTLIKLRKTPNKELVDDLNNLSLNVFNNRDLREDQDGMMQDFKDKNLNKLSTELQAKLDNYRFNEKYSYPGREVLEETISLLNSISNIKDTEIFFKEVSEKKELIKEKVEESREVKEFFKNQRDHFDKARDIIKIYDDNKDYTDDNKELKDLATETIRILTIENPYSEIHNLPSLRQKIVSVMGDIYEEKSKPIIEKINKIKTYIETETKEKELTLDLGQRYIVVCGNTIKKLESSNELKDIYATENYVDRLKDDFDNDVEKYIYQQTPSTEPKIERKVISVQNIMMKTYEIDSKEDIDKYVEDLKANLLQELEKNKHIRIK